MNKQKLIANLKQNFMVKRFRAQEECEEFIQELRRDPIFDEMYSKYSEKQMQYIKSKF